MKKILILLIFISLPLALNASLYGLGTLASPYYGVFEADKQWTFANFSDGKVFINGDVTIDNELLTIESGMKIIFVAEGADLIINGTGRLEAIGGSGSIITFTADDDDDGNYGEAPERWGHIVFDNPSGSNLSKLEYCIVEYGDVSSGSTTTSYGGAIYSNIYSNLILTNCTIRYNKATHGGGIMALSGSSPTISNCLVSENTAITSGGGIYLHTNCISTLTNCIVNNNSAGAGGGGGIFLDVSGNVRIINSIFVKNTTSASARGYNVQYYNITSTTNRPRLINCIAWGSDNSITHINTTPQATDFVNCAIRDVSTPASSYTSCIDLSSTNDLGGPNFIDPDLPGVDWSIKVISPCRDAGTDTYSGVTIPTNDIINNPKLNTKDIGAYEVQYNGWKTTASSSDWTSSSNWDLGHEPTSSENVVITVATNYPVTSSFTIPAGYGMVLEPGAKATITTLTASGDLKLRSNSSAISSLITISAVNAIVEIYLSGGGSPNYKWHYISTPVSSIATSVFTGTTSNLAQYVESLPVSDSPYSLLRGWIAYDTWSYYLNSITGSNGFSSLAPGKGYNYYYTANKTYSFSGTLNTSDPSPALGYSGIDASMSGFNLLGNPFPCGLDWQYIIDNSYPDNTSKALYFTKDNAQCAYVNGVSVPLAAGVTQFIPPMQGFFVKTYSTENTVYLSTNARTHSTHSRYKGEEIIPLVRLSISENENTDETVIRFDELAKSDLDYDFDAVKMFSSDNVSIYSSLNNTDYVVNGQPFPEEFVEIPIVVNITQEGVHTITATQLQGLDSYNVDLIDNVTGFPARLNTNPVLIFPSSTGLITDRFILKISSVTTAIENPVIPDDIFNIYHGFDLINIQTIAEEWDGKSGSVKVLDLAGKTITDLQNNEFSKNSVIQVQVPKAKGLYVVEIRSGVKRYVGKVVIR